jgi:hypothetical protein
MPHQRTSPSRYVFDLADANAARTMAQQIADKFGREVVVTDDKGNEVCVVQPLRTGPAN